MENFNIECKKCRCQIIEITDKSGYDTEIIAKCTNCGNEEHIYCCKN